MCVSGSYAQLCNAINVGDCPIHPLMDSTMMAMDRGTSWFHISNNYELHKYASMTDEQKHELERKKLEDESLRIERAKKAEEERGESILKTRITKAIGDAKDIARSFSRRKVNVSGRICSWIRLQEEAMRLLEIGANSSTLLNEKWLTPGKERISVKDAIRGCFVHNEFLKGSVTAKHDCIFAHTHK